MSSELEVSALALHMRVGGRAVARAQLRHLLDMSEQEHITIRVLPFDVGPAGEVPEPARRRGSHRPQSREVPGSDSFHRPEPVREPT
ncbi:Scr1 family TA system antitoxin-like transcriptional regulator [Streptomyces sviceus]|uniref:Scr1 family TA system antitoxin-like transcriptional regulator n=1 Tax=Streptomyces sviceus TaxID=285530 RepID=UPI0037FC6604